MRQKNIKGSEEIIKNGTYYVSNKERYKGKWQQYFKNNNPIYLEIGTGKGNFIINSAINNPNINYIGIEKFDNIIIRAIQKSNELELKNLALLKVDANTIEEIFTKEIDRIYLNFSDPWPKERHKKRRLTSKNFLEKYENIFKSNNYIEMKTDNIDLFNYTISTLEEYGYNITYQTNDLHKENIPNVMTEYEEKFSNKGIKINKLIAIKENNNL